MYLCRHRSDFNFKSSWIMKVFFDITTKEYVKRKVINLFWQVRTLNNKCVTFDILLSVDCFSLFLYSFIMNRILYAVYSWPYFTSVVYNADVYTIVGFMDGVDLCRTFFLRSRLISPIIFYVNTKVQREFFQLIER